MRSKQPSQQNNHQGEQQPGQRSGQQPDRRSGQQLGKQNNRENNQRGRQQPEREPSMGNAQFPNMLKVGRDLGCQIRPGTNNANTLTGLCPFHDSKKMQEAKTLHISVENARFWCSTCHAAGNPVTFIAKAWGVSAQEAYELIQAGYAVSAERPIWREQTQPKRMDGPPQPQNTAVLTMATRFYAQQVEQSYPALYYLARLGITPERAVEQGFGYCPGEGLREYLESQGATPEEIEASPLFQDVTGMEYLSGCLALSETDWTGATIWMMAILPEETDNGTEWPTRRPQIRGIPGRRNRLFNLKHIANRSNPVTLTDDPRLHLVLTTNSCASTLITHMRTAHNARATAERTTEGIEALRPGRIILAMHDREMGERIGQMIKDKMPETDSTHRGMADMMRQLNPMRRDLRGFTNSGPETNGPESPGDPEGAEEGKAPEEPEEISAPEAGTASDPHPPGGSATRET